MVCPLNLTEMEAIYQHEQASCVTLSCQWVNMSCLISVG